MVLRYHCSSLICFSVEGYGQFSLINSLSVRYKIVSNYRVKSLEKVLLEDPLYLVSYSTSIFFFILFLQEGPGLFLAFKLWRPANKYVQFEFQEEVVLNGLIVTTYKDYALKSFRVRANKNLNNPHLLSEDDPIVKGKNEVRELRIKNCAGINPF